MLHTLIRKGRQVAADPVLRRWLAGHFIGRFPGEPDYAAHRPPYARDLLPLAPARPAPPRPFAELATEAPTGTLDLRLAGETVTVHAGGEDDLFRRTFADRESLLSLHRFAWLPLLGKGASPRWVGALWAAWRKAHGTPTHGLLGDDCPADWTWHPYTAAERIINILDFARRHGLPAPVDDTLEVLAAHGPAMAAKLEYFGDHHTSNHLANNGRSLYRLGLELGLPQFSELGRRILIEEAGRIFLPSGVLREGSSSYHLLLTRTYVDAWLTAGRWRRAEESNLRDIAEKALAVIPRLTLPGGLPLIGDISPDCPPDFLLDGGGNTWAGLLADHERQAYHDLQRDVSDVDKESLAADGWLRADHGPWSGLWHGAPGGWSAMPGHGHQDWGGFELHYRGEAVFVDPGRGAYGDDGEAAFFRSAAAHNTVLIDGHDPYPPNRPYYGKAFRDLVGGPPPRLGWLDGAVRVQHHGFNRLGGVGAVERRWTFTPTSVTLRDSVSGAGTRTVDRYLHTPLQVEETPLGIILKGRRGTYRLHGGEAFSVRPGKIWTAYGESRAGTVLSQTTKARLPWTGHVTLEVQ